jgi:hypothetical protein
MALLAMALRVCGTGPKPNERPIALRIRLDHSLPLKVRAARAGKGLRPSADLRLKEGSGPAALGERLVAAGGVVCARCERPIVPGERGISATTTLIGWSTAAPAHRRCNRATSHRRRFSRQWHRRGLSDRSTVGLSPASAAEHEVDLAAPQHHAEGRCFRPSSQLQCCTQCRCLAGEASGPENMSEAPALTFPTPIRRAARRARGGVLPVRGWSCWEQPSATSPSVARFRARTLRHRSRQGP